MTTMDEFKETMAACNALPPENVQSLSIPVNVIAQEAQNLHEVAETDKEELAGAGMDLQCIDQLEKAGMFLRYTEAEWSKVRGNRAEAQQLWNEKSPAGFKLHETLLHNFRFAFRNQDETLARIRSISDGNSNADMIQDLINLSVLGKEYTEDLEKIGFDLTLLDTAEKTAAELTELLARATLNSSEENETLEMRDRAFTHLKALMSEIREYGKFVFHNDKKHLREYTSAYIRKINQSSKKTQPEETEEMQEAV